MRLGNVPTMANSTGKDEGGVLKENSGPLQPHL